MKNKYISLLLIQLFTIFFSSFNTLFLIKNLSTEEYAKYSLYILGFFYMGLITFGIQDSVKVKLRKKKINEINKKYFNSRLNIFISLELFFSILIIFFALMNDNLNYFLVIFLLSNIAQSIINYHKQFFSTSNNLFILKFVELSIPFAIFLFIIYGKKFNFENFIIFNFLIRYLVMIFIMFYMNKKKKKMNNNKNSIKIKDDFKDGTFIFFGTWFLTSILTIDAILLSNELFIVGQLSIIKSISYLVVSLFIPLTLYIKSEINLNDKSIVNLIMKLSVILLFLEICLIPFVAIISQKMDINPQMVKIVIVYSFIIVKIVSILNPFMIMKENTRLYKKSILIFLIYVIILVVLVKFIFINIFSLILIEILLYSLIYIIFIWYTGKNKVIYEILILFFNLIYIFY